MKDIKDLSILFLCKKDNEYALRAADFIRHYFQNTLIFAENRTVPLSEEVLNWKGDILVSFISSWILPASLLDNARIAAINFHPGSPEYPGTGCTNFAVYNGETNYGVTVHHMKATVDTGNIIAVKRFPIRPEESVFEITRKCHSICEELFYQIMNDLLEGKPLPTSGEQWTRKPYTRKQLDALCELTPGMTEEEMNRRVRATTYRKPWAYLKLGEHKYKLEA